MEEECGVAVKILMVSEIPFLAKSFPNCLPNHCLATAKLVKLDIVAPVTNPPKNASGSSNNCNNRLMVSNSINADAPPCALTA
ncbi:hypothetical protein D3C72_1976370 [compost metagenome]